MESGYTMTLKLICKYGDVYAVRRDDGKYVYYSEADMRKIIEETAPEERNCIIRKVGDIALKKGVLPILGVGVNFIGKCINASMPNVEYISDYMAWIYVNNDSLVIDEELVAMVKDLGYTWNETQKRWITEQGIKFETMFLPVNIQILIVAYNVMKEDKLYAIDISACNIKDDKFRHYMSSFKMIYFCDSNFSNAMAFAENGTPVYYYGSPMTFGE